MCTHIVHLETHTQTLKYYRGNYDSFVDTRRDANIEQMKRREAEQADIAAMKGESVTWSISQSVNQARLLET